MVLGAENYAAQDLKAKESSCVEKFNICKQGLQMQAFCACIQNYTILSILSIEVNEVHVLLYMAMTP